MKDGILFSNQARVYLRHLDSAVRSGNRLPIDILKYCKTVKVSEGNQRFSDLTIFISKFTPLNEFNFLDKLIFYEGMQIPT